MKRKIVFYGFLAILLLVLFLPACAKTTPTTQVPSATTTIAPSPTSTTPKPTTTAPSPTTTAPSPTTTAPSPTTTPSPQYGGVLRIIYRGALTNIGLPGAAGTPDDGVFYSPCVQKLISLDEKGNFVPCLATSWQVSPDYKSITFNLRKGVKFHDGTDFNATAAKYCLDLDRTGPRPDLKSVSSVDVVDDYTVRLNFSTYDPAILNNLSLAVGIMVSPTAINANVKDWGMLHPVGTGPYKFVSFQRDVSLKYERFDNYWGGKPYLDGLEWVFIADPVTALASFKAGEAQASGIVGLKDTSDLKASGKYNVNTSIGYVSALVPDSGNATSPFYDIRVRQAVAYAIDNAAIAKTVGYGFFTTTNQLAAPESWWYNPAVVGYPYNPQKAKQLLADAGYGTSGLKTTITFEATPENQDTFNAVQAYLSAVGIDAKLDAADTSRFVNVYSNGWKNGLVRWSAPVSLGSDPTRGIQTALSSKRSRYISADIPADYDAALSKAAAEPDPAKRVAAFQNVMKIITDQYCMVIPLYLFRYTAVYTSQVHDFQFNGLAPGVWHPEKVWLSK